jgi:hypothetical protein
MPGPSPGVTKKGKNLKNTVMAALFAAIHVIATT